MKWVANLIIFVLLAGFVEAAVVHGTVYDFYLEKAADVKIEVNSTPKQAFVSKDGGYSFKLPVGAYLLKAQKISGNEPIAYAEELVEITSKEGDFVLDLILFPEIDEDLDIDLSLEEQVLEDEYFKPQSRLKPVLLAAAIAALAFVIYFIFRLKNIVKKKKKIRTKPVKNVKSESKIRLKEEAAHKETEQEKAVEIRAKSANLPEIDDFRSLWKADIAPGKSETLDNDYEKLINFIKEQGGRVTQKDIRKRFPSSEAKISLILTEMEEKGVIKKIKKGRGNIIILKKK